MTQVAKNIDDVLTTTAAPAVVTNPGDPAPSDHDLLLRQMMGLMMQISDGAVGELRRLRDDVDACIRSIQFKHADLADDFEHHVSCVAESMAFRDIASKHLDNVRARFAIPTQRKSDRK